MLLRTGPLAALLSLSLAACTKDEPPRAPTAEPAAAARPAEPAAGSAETAEAGGGGEVAPAPQPLSPADAEALRQASIATLDGEPTSLAAFDGKALLLVNVASKCGLTPQYSGLEELQKSYAERGFTVIGLPCNQFGGQEPGSAEEIKTFCSTTYGVTFPMMEKIEVNGDGRHPIYEVLTRHADTEGKAGDVEWNFEKFLVSADREHVTRFRPRTEPDDPALIAAIEAALPQQ